MFLWEILDNAAESVPTRTALVASGRRWSFAELAADARTPRAAG
ncbi:MAG: hypothetical protein M5U19_12275 [Microthrixaceae bacterium]|nr:hypothetical protein [Microthrixaceae bacterium]